MTTTIFSDSNGKLRAVITKKSLTPAEIAWQVANLAELHPDVRPETIRWRETTRATDAKGK